MATCNGEKFIGEQIRSIAAQSHKHIELVIQDDCSTDGTVQVIESFRNQIEIRLEVNQQRLGFVRNFERAISRAAGDYIALCDQDDVWVDDKIAALLDAIGDADLIHTNCQLIDETGALLAPSWKKAARARVAAAQLLFYNDMTGCTALFKRRLLDQALPFPDGLAYHDWWLAICASTRHGVKFLDRPLVKYRQHGAQNTGAFETKGVHLFNTLRKLRVFSGAEKKLISAKQLRNLDSGKAYLLRHLPGELVRQAMDYHRSLSKGLFHWRAFMIGVRMPGTLRPGDRLAVVKLVTNDLIG
jgi:glycosyltransferase involved in cell wall biosynthesis